MFTKSTLSAATLTAATLTALTLTACASSGSNRPAVTNPRPLIVGDSNITITKGGAAERPVRKDRFDLKVRGDFFDGLRGDAAAFARAMALTETTLAANPKHAEALVWHGSGLLFRSGQAFRSGDRETGGKLWTQGLAEMDRAAALEPDNLGVRIPRGAGLLAVAAFVPADLARGLIETAVADYEVTLAIQRPYFDTLSLHARAQLLYGLGDGWSRLGDTGRGKRYFQRVVAECHGSNLQPLAEERLTGKPARPAPCGSCHAAGGSR